MDEISKQYAKKPNSKKSNSSLRIKRKKASQPLKSHADRILFLQRTIGNQAVQRLIKSGTLQAKLTIGQPNDNYEQEADRVAEVMRMPEPKVQRQVEPEEEEEELQRQPIEEELQAKATSGHISNVNPHLESQIQSLKGGGRPLSANDRAFFEPRFGRDFSQVRLHTDTRTAEAAKAVNAKAYTLGKDVVFGAGQYAPRMSEGKRLLAHELMHVVQQSGDGHTMRRGIIDKLKEAAERKAEEIAKYN